MWSAKPTQRTFVEAMKRQGFELNNDGTINWQATIETLQTLTPSLTSKVERDARTARESSETFRRTGAGEQAS